MMDPTRKQKWIDALRSGKYTQARGSLKLSEGFCCLGVELDVNGCDWKWGPATAAATICAGFNPYFNEVLAGTTVSWDNSYAAAAGVTRVQLLQLMSMNDDGKTFPEIADWIEENL